MTTAGNLVFQTVNDGRLLAYSADRGEKLLEIQTGLRSGMGPPITYRLDGKQYVALMGGVGAVAAGNAAGPGNAATPFSPKLLVFALDGKAPLPGREPAVTAMDRSGHLVQSDGLACTSQDAGHENHEDHEEVPIVFWLRNFVLSWLHFESHIMLRFYEAQDVRRGRQHHGGGHGGRRALERGGAEPGKHRARHAEDDGRRVRRAVSSEQQLGPLGQRGSAGHLQPHHRGQAPSGSRPRQAGHLGVDRPRSQHRAGRRQPESPGSRDGAFPSARHLHLQLPRRVHDTHRCALSLPAARTAIQRHEAGRQPGERLLARHRHHQERHRHARHSRGYSAPQGRALPRARARRSTARTSRRGKRRSA